MSTPITPLEIVMLNRFLEAASPADILLWHRSELEKVIAMARASEREHCIQVLEEHLRNCTDGRKEGWHVGHQEDIHLLKALPEPEGLPE